MRNCLTEDLIKRWVQEEDDNGFVGAGLANYRFAPTSGPMDEVLAMVANAVSDDQFSYSRVAADRRDYKNAILIDHRREQLDRSARNRNTDLLIARPNQAVTAISRSTSITTTEYLQSLPLQIVETTFQNTLQD